MSYYCEACNTAGFGRHFNDGIKLQISHCAMLFWLLFMFLVAINIVTRVDSTVKI